MNLKEALHGLYVIEVAPTSRPSRGRWWQPERSGYTNEIAEAGLYDQAEAGEIERKPEHVARPVADVLAELGKPVIKAEQKRKDADWERMKQNWRVAV